MFEYWRQGLRDRVLTVDFNGGGCSVEPEERTHHEGGQTSTSTEAVELAQDNIAIFASSHTCVGGCEPANPGILVQAGEGIATRSEILYRRCSCLGNCKLSCGCRGHWFLPPPASRATVTLTGDTVGGHSGGNSGARGRSHHGSGKFAANHERRKAKEPSNFTRDLPRDCGSADPCRRLRYRGEVKVIYFEYDTIPIFD